MDAAGDRPADAVTQTATPVGDVRGAAVKIEGATKIGRFTVLGTLGAGGMGQVFSAYDPQLDRRVALKLLRGHVSAVERQRLLREAQALARVTHPNVVVVHDVGSHEGHVYVAMEYVQGTTLRDWMDTHPLDAPGRLARALELLRDAARGIEAAHAAGLVHRDVKPRNILVGDDGRVRVVDFGLARSSGALPVDEMMSTNRALASADLSEGDAAHAGVLLEETLTQTGSIIGTPAYMAPEQYRPGEVEPAADQFALCVTAWEVLFGVRPFRGPPLAMLAAIREGTAERPEGIELPEGLEEALRRGLSHRRGRRHANMGAVIEALERALASSKGEPVSRRPVQRSRVLVVALVGAAAASAFWLGSRDAIDCDGGDAHVAALWAGPRRDAIEAAMKGSPAEFAAGVWSRLAEHVPAWQASWSAAHRDACEATHVRHEQSEHVMDLRMACLEDRRVALEAYLDRLADGGVEAIATADAAFAELPTIDRCADATYVQARGLRSEDPEIAAIEDAVLVEVARSDALMASGDYDGALEVALGAVAMAGASEVAQAHAFLAEGRARVWVTPREAIAPLEAAHSLAQIHGLPEIAARSSLDLLSVLGTHIHASSKALVWLPIAEADAQRLAETSVSAVLHTIAARVLMEAGQLGAAEASLARAFEELEAGGGEDTVLYARALARRAALPTNVDRVADARAALELARSILGPQHPDVVGFHQDVGRSFVGEAEFDAAVREFETALAITVAAVGESHRWTSDALIMLGDAQLGGGRVREGRRNVEQAIAIRRALGLEDANLVLALSTLSLAERSDGDLSAALEHARAAYELSSRLLGEREVETASQLIAWGRLESLLGDTESGRAHVRLGLALGEDLSLTGTRKGIMMLEAAAVNAMEEGRLREGYEAYVALDRMLTAQGVRDVSMQFVVRANCCSAAHDIGAYEEALAHCAGARALLEGREGDPLGLAHLEVTNAAPLLQLGRFDEAAASLKRALAVFRAADHVEPAFPIALANLAEIDLLNGDPTAAKQLYLESVDVRTKYYHARHPLLVTPLVGASAAALALGERREAIALAERALGISRDAADPVLSAKAKEAVVLARWQPRAAGTLRAELRAQMQEALTIYEAQGNDHLAKDVARVRAWLANH